MTDLVRRGIPFGAGLRGHTDAVLWGCWGVRDGRPVLATGGRDFTVRLWDPVTGKQSENTMRGEPAVALVWGAWTGDRTDLAVGGLDGRSWLLARGATTLKPFSRAYERSTVCGGWTTVPDGQALVVVDDQGLASWDHIPASGPEDGFHQVHGATGVLWGAWAGAGQWSYAATGSADGKVRFWDLATGRPQGIGKVVHPAPSRWGAWAVVTGRPVLATPGKMHSVVLWDPIRKADVGTPLMGHFASVTWGGWGEVDGELRLATGSADRTVRIWDPADGTQVRVFEGHKGRVSWGAWATIGGEAVLATGDDACTVRLWNPNSGRPIGEPLKTEKRTHWGSWEAVDGRAVLATGGEDSVVQLWEIIDQRPIGKDLPHYRSDALKNRSEAPTIDDLDRIPEAKALAGLVTARSASPPLAVGLFGDWGEGKSHFMALLQDEVAKAADTHSVLAHSHVRQVRFNAWHYAETDLWASLVSELFTQLASTESGAEPIDERQQLRLASELNERRGLLQRIEAAKGRRDALRAALERPGQRWKRLSPVQQQEIRDLAGEQPERLYSDVVRAASQSWRSCRTFPWGLMARVFVPLALVALVVAAVARWHPPMSELVVPLSGGVAVAQFLVRQYRQGRRRAETAWTSVANFVRQQNQRLIAAAEAANEEVVALERQKRDFTAAGQLAGVVADRAASTDYRSRLDVMSRIRQDFDHMARLLARTEPDRTEDEVGDELPQIDRIVIYIDDLDRCPPARVVETLEAVHLLLAVSLFVVVVAVDPKWLLAAIKARYRDMTNPTQYLEKIFQVVLALPALSTTGYQCMVRRMVRARIDEEPMAAREAASAAVPALPLSRSPRTAHLTESVDHGVRLPGLREVDRIDPFGLDPDEIRLLDLVGPSRLILTPRQTKRMTNSYGLLTALRGPAHLDDLKPHLGYTCTDADPKQEVEYHPYRAGLVLLAALIARPGEASDFVQQLQAAAVMNPHGTWTGFLAGRADDRLAASLSEITGTAAAERLALPEPLEAWAEWIVPVSRLSFPAGSVR
jgi:WD40 repeat protein